MNTKDAFKSSMDLSLFVFTHYFSDLDDADLLKRPPGCNHLAWQIGHLISSEVGLVGMLAPGKAPSLPEGFNERHSKETTGVDDPSKFQTKQEYLDLFTQVRATTLQVLEAFPEEKFDSPAPERLRARFPTMGSVFTLIGMHPMMHAGQVAVVRRMLGKPVLI